MNRILRWFVILMLLPISGRAAELYTDFPSVIHADERYVIYSHGLIVEGDNPRPVSPMYGQYDFPAIKQALFDGGRFNLIAYQRPKNADFDTHARLLESWVRRLRAAGVKASRITLVGFSRGGQLTAVASGHLAEEGINTAILAICQNGDFDITPPVALGGNFLSIYETSDVLGSCGKLAARSHLASFKEVAISTGKGHGAFFQPRPEWLAPLRAWIDATNR
jgi:pimeloyl-ACP methyl ester carboxylesterase